MELLAAVNEFILDRESYGRTPATLRFYSSNLRRLAAWLEHHGVYEIEECTRSHVRAFFAELHRSAVSENTVAAYDRAVRAFCAFCKTEGYIDVDPMEGRPRERPSRDLPDTLEFSEIQRLLAMCDDSQLGRRDRSLMLLMLDTGMRAGEVVRMRPEHLRSERDRGRIVVPGTGSKGKAERVVCIWAETLDAMREWLDVRPPQAETVYVASNGSTLSIDPLTVSGLNQMMRRRARSAGVEKSKWCHIWRHTFAKTYVLAGGDLETLRRLLGHKSLATVQIYLGFKTRDLEEKHFELSPVRRLFEQQG